MNGWWLIWAHITLLRREKFIIKILFTAQFHLLFTFYIIAYENSPKVTFNQFLSFTIPSLPNSSEDMWFKTSNSFEPEPFRHFFGFHKSSNHIYVDYLNNVDKHPKSHILYRKKYLVCMQLCYLGLFMYINMYKWFILVYCFKCIHMYNLGSFMCIYIYLVNIHLKMQTHIN